MKGDKVVEGTEEDTNFLLLSCTHWIENLSQSQVISIDCWVASSSTIIQNNFHKPLILNKTHQEVPIYAWSHLSVPSRENIVFFCYFKEKVVLLVGSYRLVKEITPFRQPLRSGRCRLPIFSSMGDHFRANYRF